MQRQRLAVGAVLAAAPALAGAVARTQPPVRVQLTATARTAPGPGYGAATLAGTPDPSRHTTESSTRVMRARADLGRRDTAKPHAGALVRSCGADGRTAVG